MRKILVVVDMQKDFIDGSLGTKEAVSIIDNVCEEIKKYDVNDIYVTRDTHQENYLESSEGRLLPVVHCIENTEGWQLNSKIQPLLEGAHFINKPTFGSVELANLLVEENKKEPLDIELIGLCTDICVVSNALLLKAHLYENHISVNSQCCAGVTPESHEAALNTMRSCQIDIF